MALKIFPPVLLLALLMASCAGRQPLMLPGPASDGRTLLPNGWSLTPVGEQVPLGELPLNMVVSADGATVVVTNNGTKTQELTVIDVPTWTVRQTVPLGRSWLGLAYQAGGGDLLVSGGNDNDILRFRSLGGRLAFRDSIKLGERWPRDTVWVAGVAAGASGAEGFAVGRESRAVYRFDADAGAVTARAALPDIPYGCLYSRAHKVLFVSLWGGSAVALVDPMSLAVRSLVRVDDHPCDMAESPDGARLFVACANSNFVDVVDIAAGKVSERLNAALYPGAPAGSTPNAVALDPAGQRLAVANADNNCVALFDVSVPGASRSLGFIPTGWYPTAVRFHPGSGDLLVACAKGLSSAPDPYGPRPDRKRRRMGRSHAADSLQIRKPQEEQYIGSMFKGVLSRIRMPDQATLASWTQMVYANSPLGAGRGLPDSCALWARPGRPSPIKHIFYLIKENRTYDQVFGDLPEGNGDSSLCLFPDSVTPNIHALAREFVLLDNFYCDAEVSADGHNWSMGAYATDYTEKTWPTSYGGRGGQYEFEGGYPAVYPSAGYLWDNCQRNGASYRTYGEWTINPGHPGDSARPQMPSLAGHVAPGSMGWDLKYSDVDRVAAWEREFAAYERNGGLPQFQIIKLPNDHTEGTARGSLTPRAFVAQNDLAVGLLVERISRSRYWKESAIFIIEDDAQDGPDHVDAHRTEALVISPFIRRHSVDHGMYSTSSMVRTMELLLGLPPMSQFDASARPMTASFPETADTAPFVHRQARIDIGERNTEGALGQRESGRMDFSREDAAPMGALTAIVWGSVKGPDVPVPPPVRAAHVRPLKSGDPDD